MGNIISYELDEDLESESDNNQVMITLDASHLNNTLNNVVGQIMSSINRPSLTMPVIRKKPDLSTFRHTQMFKEIKALCGERATSNRPTSRWSLIREIQKRESGIPSSRNGTSVFSDNQQRSIANFYVPNEKDKRLMSLESKIFICKFNSDGSKLITASQDSFLRIFDSSKGTYHRINRIKAKDVHWSILDIDFSPCGKYFAYCTWLDQIIVVPVDGTVDDFRWIDLRAETNRCGIFSLRFSPDGSTIICGSNNSSVYTCDRETQTVKSILTERTHQIDINAVSYVSEHDSNIFLTGCDNGVVKLWDVRVPIRRRANPQPVGTFMGHLDGITYIDPRNDGNNFLTNSKDQSVKLWDIRRTTSSNKLYRNYNLPLLPWNYRWDTVPREYYNPIQSNILDSDVSIMTYRGHRVTKSLLRAKFSPKTQTGQRYIYTGCGTGRIIIYDVLTGYIKEAIEGHKDIVRDLSWHPTRSEIVSASWDSHVNLNTFKRNKLLKRTNTESQQGPRRRSRRIANQNGDLCDLDEIDD